MPMQRQHIAIAAAALLSVWVRALSAQEGPARLSVDGAVGSGHGWRGGERVDRTLIVGDLLVVVRLNQPRHGFPVGLEASRDWQINGDKICVVGSDGRCIPQYPGFHGLAVVSGHQWQPLAAMSVRVLAGPGYYTVFFKDDTPTAFSLGLGGRADVAVPLFRPVSATIAARGAWVPRIHGRTYVPSAVMIGIRLDTGG